MAFRLYGIGFFLPHDVGKQHADSVTGKAAPRTCHIAVFRHKDKVNGQKRDYTDCGKNSPHQVCLLSLYQNERLKYTPMKISAIITIGMVRNPSQ